MDSQTKQQYDLEFLEIYNKPINDLVETFKMADFCKKTILCVNVRCVCKWSILIIFTVNVSTIKALLTGLGLCSLSQLNGSFVVVNYATT